MRRPGYTGDVWPDDVQQLLLQAAFLHGDRGLDAWCAVRPRIDIDRLPGELHRLMPRLSKALSGRRLDDADLPRLKGVYQFTWYRNTLLFTEAARLVERLGGAGIPTMLLRGGGLVLGHGGDVGLRPMNDLDLLVRREDLDRARQVATTVGWGPLVQGLPVERKLGTAPLRSPQGLVVRLHWEPSPNLSFPGAAWDVLWRRAVPARIYDVDTLVPSAADHLLHACVDGVRADSGASLRWVTDSMVLLHDARSPVDWDHLTAEAERLRCSLVLSEALQYLVQEMGARVPDGERRRIAALPTTVRDRAAHRLSLTTAPRVPPAAEVVGRVTRLTAHLPVHQAVQAAPDVLMNVVGVERRRAVPGAVARKLARAVASPQPPRSSLSRAGAVPAGAQDQARRSPREVHDAAP